MAIIVAMVFAIYTISAATVFIAVRKGSVKQCKI